MPAFRCPRFRRAALNVEAVGTKDNIDAFSYLSSPLATPYPGPDMEVVASSRHYDGAVERASIKVDGPHGLRHSQRRLCETFKGTSTVRSARRLWSAVAFVLLGTCQDPTAWHLTCRRYPLERSPWMAIRFRLGDPRFTCKQKHDYASSRSNRDF